MRGSIRPSVLVVLAVLVFSAACGDDDGLATVGGEATSATQAVESTTATTTTSTPATTAAPTTAAPTTAPTTVAIPLTASERLEGFFLTAEDIDRRIAAAAVQFNDTLDVDTGTVSAVAEHAIAALDTGPLVLLIPGGMSVDLEVAVLAVFADLDSRIAALTGGLGDLECLPAGGESARRFPDDLATARSLAATAPAPVAAPGSPESGMVAVRLRFIQGSNWCCGSCGGYAYDEQIGVDWEGRVFGPGWINAPFEATFDGEGWQVEFPAAG